MNFSVEEFLEGIEKAKKFIPKKPTIVVKNATVTGVKLNSKTINSIPKSEEPISFYEGIKVYQDDSLDKPRFIVEGEIEKKNYLKWEDLEFIYGEAKKLVVSLGNEIFEIRYWSDFDFFNNQYEVVEICNINTKSCICKIYDRNKYFFNNLHLVVIENE